MSGAGEMTVRRPEWAAVAQGRDDNANELDVLAIGRVLRRHVKLILGMTILAGVVVATIVEFLTPMYSATSYVMIDPGQTKIVDAIAAVMAGSGADTAAVESEARVLQSRELADRVITKLSLDKDPEFNSALRPPGLLDPYLKPIKNAISITAHAIKGWIVTALGGEAEEPAAPGDPQRALRAKIIDAVLAELDVEVDGRSRVIAITFTSQSGATAAAAANTLVDLYIVRQLEAKFDAAKSANQWLNDRLADLRERVEASEAAAEQYRAQHGLIENRDVTITTQEASDLGAQLAVARSRRADAEARLREVGSAIGKPNGTAAISEVLGSGLIQALREQEAQVQRKVSDLSQKLGPKHPDLLSAKAELQQIRVKIDAEVRKIVEGLKNELVASQAREASLTETLERLKGQAGEQNQTEVKLRALDREATASRTLLETFLQRAQETGSQESYQEANAHIVSKADVPQNPAFPRKNVMIAAGFAAALMLAVMLAFLLEFLDQSFRSEEQLEDVLGVASLGLIPSLKGSWGKSKRASTYVAQHPASAYVESMRDLYTGLRLSNGADLRKPSMHQALAVAQSPGLVDHLRQRVPLESVIQHDKATGIDAIAAGTVSVNPPDLLGANEMRDMLARLTSTYDIVIIDSAPLLAVSDTRVLVRMVDRIIFLVRWADTRRETAVRALQQIADAGDGLAGTMLTMVDFNRYAKYRYGAFSRYYHQVAGYYTS